MTTEDLGWGLGQGDEGDHEDERALAPQPRARTVEEVLALVDRILAEPGRRRHLFGWLRRPGGGREDWLSVDAYYPSNRLVVMCVDRIDEHGEIYRELIPAHGLRLLEVRPDERNAPAEVLRTMLERRIGELGPSPRRAPAVAGRQAAVVFPAIQTGSGSAARASSAMGDSQAAGVIMGLALTAALVIEIYVGVARLGFGSGNVLLAFALALDACSRLLGTFAALRAGEREWAWWCALGGSPLAAGFALMQRSGPVRTEPAPLAGILGVVAIVVLALAALAGALEG